MDQARLQQVLTYNPETGLFTRKPGVLYRTKSTPPGCKVKRGKTFYLQIRLDGKLYYAHRLAWLYMTGEDIPSIDHRDGDGLNNRWSNLRPATQAENVRNRGRAGHNTTGFKGVFRRGKGFYSQIVVNRKAHYLGSFDTPEEAHRAYCEAAARLHGDFARTE